MIKRYNYQVDGVVADGTSFSCSGTVEAEFADIFNTVVQRTFQDLTNGRAVYGHPGVGCKGPYDVRKIALEKITETN